MHLWMNLRVHQMPIQQFIKPSLMEIKPISSTWSESEEKRQFNQVAMWMDLPEQMRFH